MRAPPRRHPRPSSTPRPRRLWLAAAAAALAHGALLFWLASSWRATPAPPGSTTAQPAPARQPQTWSVALLDPADTPAPHAGPVPEAVPGSHDHSAQLDTHPLPRAERDLPGQHPARTGGGAPGGKDSWTGRHDRENFETQIWNDPHRNRLPRQPRTGRASRSPESIARQPGRAFDDRSDSRRQARTGAEQATPGGARAETAGATTAARDWLDADPLFDGPPGSQIPERLRGAVSPRRTRALVDSGDHATESPDRGPTSDPLAVAAASSQTRPAPIEMTAPRAGGTRHGVAGPHPGPGPSPRGNHSPGSAATTADARRGPAELSVRARRHHPYFRRMYQRLDAQVEFPRELAVSLRQGQVVVRFTLSAQGSVHDATVIKSSGYAAFDRQVMRALENAAPFGPVPAAVLDGRSSLTVAVPYGFRNSLIR